MIKTLIFPERDSRVKANEYAHHYLFIKKYAELAGINVLISKHTEHVFCTDKTWFSVLIDGQQAMFDYSDHQSLTGYTATIPYFKFHYNLKLHAANKNAFPTGPMLDIQDIAGYHLFFQLCNQHFYTCNSDKILNCQLPRHRALERRKLVQQVLNKNFPDMVDTSFVPGKQVEFWNKHKNCLVAISVPGARNNMLDRGHYEQLALGVCVISPKINTLLPYRMELIPKTHYLNCADDYSDLVELINWCQRNRERCRAIGNQARQLFMNYCMPEKYWCWIEACLKKEENQ